ncbi:MAG: ArgE/DapE family deacylase [Leptolinea sp.]|jgi:acetylornithine deacetylase|nr:ArgE/DapE family deacylase [Leptolinea sp.]
MDELEKLICDLVSIDSVNPDLSPGGRGEEEVARFAAGWLEKAGLEVHLDEVKPGRPNVIAVARGSGGGRTLMLNGHTDVVNPAGMPDAFKPVIRDGRLYGRGSYDMKGGLAACMLAAARASTAKLRGDVILTAVMDEEYAGLGTIHAAGRYKADAAIIAEATGMELVVAHRGFVWLEIETIGVAAHGSRPDLGVDAISKMGYVLTALDRLNKDLMANPRHPLLGGGSLHASLIQGGLELATYPDRCCLSIERRTIPGETPESVEEEIRQILAAIHEKDPSFKADVRRLLYRSPMETPQDAEILPVIRQTSAAVLGHPVTVSGVPYWTDAATLSAAGIPCVLFGPSGAGAHAVEEWVNLDSVRDCAEIYLAAAQEFCR